MVPRLRLFGVLFLAAAAAAASGPGSLDPSFGGGRIITPFSGGGDAARAVAVQPDGKVVAAGDNGAGSGDFALARYLADGSLDASFGSGGRVTTDFGFSETARGVAVQPNGRIVAVGYSVSGDTYSFALARYLADGSLDQTFGVGGKVTNTFGATSPAYGLCLQPDGRILVAGIAAVGGRALMAVARYETNGNLDATFGSNGLVTTDLGGTEQGAVAITLQPDGHIVAAGFVSDTMTGFALARYNTDGSLDATFGNGGFVVTHLGTYLARGVAIQPDGKILAAGDTQAAGVLTYGFALARYNADGSLDPAFGTNGVVISDFGFEAHAGRSLLLQPDGKIVVGGGRFAVALYDEYGNLDPSFGNDGLVATNFYPLDDGSYGLFALALDPAGRIIAAGGANMGFLLARLGPDGYLDGSFGPPSGKAVTDFGDPFFYSDQLNALAVQSDGRIVAAGGQAGGGSDQFAVVRYNTDGNPDARFGPDGTGMVGVDFGPGLDLASAVAIQGDGKIVVAGQAYIGGKPEFALARLDADGSLDAGFGTAGLVTTDIGGLDSRAYAVAIQGNGKIVAAGSALGTTLDFAMARYNSDGTLDDTFGAGGLVTTDFAGTTDYVRAVAIQGDKILVAGGSSAYFALARYDTNGALDSGFGSGGKVIQAIYGLGDAAFALAFDSSGRILVAGPALNGSTSDFGLARFDANGTPDTSFGTGGVVATDFGGKDDQAYGIAVQPDAKILVGGTSGNGIGTYSFALCRYGSDGSLDASFGIAGKVTTDFTGLDDLANAMVLLPDGRIVLGGTVNDTGPGSPDFGLARYFAVDAPSATAASPDSGPASGGTTLTITGSGFLSGATLTVGGQAAANVVVGNTQVSGEVPPGSPGAVAGLVVKNPDTQSSSIPDAFVYDFLDVPPANIFHDYVVRVARHRITAGCGGGNYCPSSSVTRAQMAVFLLKGKNGSAYVPPSCSGVFPDVPCPGGFAVDWIEALAAAGITGGCGGGSYCPSNPVTRAQMAVFLLKAEHGSGYTPPACTGIFPDVACPSLFADWIERLAAESITGGCGGGNYCPSNPNTRGQMAVFLSKTFALP
jgi:uncharacterized delta-60 repeat protein